MDDIKDVGWNRRDLDRFLAGLAERFIRGVSSQALGIREGMVMSLAGAAPYRRIDCDGKALCYVRCRPMRRGLRVDVSGLWRRPFASRLELPGATGLTLLLTTREEVDEAISFLRSIVAATREA